MRMVRNKNVYESNHKKWIKIKTMNEQPNGLKLVLFICFTISIILVALYVAKQEQIEKEIEYNETHYSPMRIHQKY